MEITDEEFELLLDRNPLDEDGNVRYPQFLLRFDYWYAVHAFYFSFVSRIISNLKGSQTESHFLTVLLYDIFLAQSVLITFKIS